MRSLVLPGRDGYNILVFAMSSRNKVCTKPKYFKIWQFALVSCPAATRVQHRSAKIHKKSPSISARMAAERLDVSKTLPVTGLIIYRTCATDLVLIGSCVLSL